MKKLILSSLILSAACFGVSAQTAITISASDMPVNGDKLLYSTSLPSASLNLSNTGANIAWDYSSLNPVAQAIDTYKTAIQAGYIGGGIAVTAYGYKIADTLGFSGAPVSAEKVYTFFSIKSSPSRFVAEGFGATISGFPVPAGYSKEDTIYSFPMTFGNGDTTVFKLSASLSGFGTLKQEGVRMRTVDGWGTIKTPYFTTAVPVIRVRSEVNELDSITFLGTAIPVPRHYVEYKWLTNGEHYPALFVTATVLAGNETPTTVRYRDMQRALGVVPSSPAYSTLQVYPNPANGSTITVQLPSAWKAYTLSMYDATGKRLAAATNTPILPTASLPSGKYLIVAESGSEMGAAQFVK